MKQLTGSNNVWVDIHATSNITNKSQRTIKRYCKKGKYTSKLVPGNGGEQYRILLSSLPVEAQIKYFNSIQQSDPGGQVSTEQKNLPKSLKMEDTPYTEEQVDVGLTRSTLVGLYIKKSAQNGAVLKKKESFLTAYNNKALPEIYKKLGPVSFETIERWKRTYLKNNKNYLSLVPKYKPRVPAITSEQADVLLRYALHPNAPKISEVIRRTISELDFKGISPIHKPITYRRHLDNWKKENFDIWTFYRRGDKAFNDECLPSIERDYDKIEVGDILVADGHTLNFEILDPYSGKPKRMTMILFYDMKSNMPLGYEIMPSENTMSIAVALMRSILMLGKIPKVLYFDNGKAFSSKYFKGVDLETDRINGLIQRLGCRAIFAKAYHAQSKTIERFFGTFAELERMMPTYVGTSIELKPPRMNRGERLHRAVYDKMVDVRSFTIFTAFKAISWWFDQYANREQQSGRLAGKTPMEIFLPGKGPGIDKKELTFLMLSRKISKIYANGIRFRNTYYWHENLFGLRKEVLIKYDLLETDSVFVVDIKTGQFICEAKRTDKVHPAASILGTEEDVEKLQNKLETIERLKKSVTAPFKKFAEEEILPSTIRQLEQADILSFDEGRLIMERPETTKERKNKKHKRDLDYAIELLGYGAEEPPVEEEKLILWDNEVNND